MEYKTRVLWRRSAAPFNPKSFDRTHTIYFGSGFSIEASSAPEFLGRTDLPNPEELFTAAVSSCFMLTFLYWAAAEGLKIDRYQDRAIGILGKDNEGKMAMTEVILQPQVDFANNNNPDPILLQQLFDKAHEHCFISTSIKAQISIRAVQKELA